jgi:hypothetical protein
MAANEDACLTKAVEQMNGRIGTPLPRWFPNPAKTQSQDRWHSALRAQHPVIFNDDTLQSAIAVDQC